MNQSLFLFSIGPVQSFIAQARKTQDLYAGSYILSHLCRTGAQKLLNEAKGGEIVFPNIENEFIPNRFIAIVGETAANLKVIGKKVEECVRLEFKRIADEALNKLGLEKPQGFDEQVTKQLSIQWVALPFEEKSYQASYKKLENLLGAIKNTRGFEQLEETGRKCSICGERNVKFYRKTRDESKSGKNVYKKLFSRDVRIFEYDEFKNAELKHLQPGEGLCGVCFTKRVAEKYFTEGFEKDFPSTAKIALLGALDELKKDSVNIPRKIGEQAIFDLKNGREPGEDLTDEEKENAKKIYGALKEKNISFSSYYAVLLFDGDNMGEKVSEPDLKKGVSLKDYHKALTGKLGEFADRATRNIIVEPRGHTVYAGGEDFLGFINLNYLFKIMKDLREEFGKIDLSEYADEEFTFSAGVAMAHIKTPLSEVLKWARKMEKEAKEINGGEKDALGIAVLKRSGEINKVVFKWKAGEKWVTDIISNIYNSLRSGKFSNKFIKNLNIEFLKLVDDSGSFNDEKIVELEIKRLLTKSCMVLGDNEKKELITKLAEDLFEMFLASGNVGNFLSALNIADFMAREVK
ncbi:MAG: CRISPR-associated protein Cmr2 [Thermosediminibacterales bacterium]|nr:CRISPR-associated protein Cmr2 [Thermosediminibacterales bacterium]MDK2836503.1 CRISPR-associated protein Cmr2 [Thermosediminibacterales bacterium]